MKNTEIRFLKEKRKKQTEKRERKTLKDENFMITE